MIVIIMIIICLLINKIILAIVIFNLVRSRAEFKQILTTFNYIGLSIQINNYDFNYFDEFYLSLSPFLSFFFYLFFFFKMVFNFNSGFFSEIDIILCFSESVIAHMYLIKEDKENQRHLIFIIIKNYLRMSRANHFGGTRSLIILSHYRHLSACYWIFWKHMTIKNKDQ